MKKDERTNKSLEQSGLATEESSTPKATLTPGEQSLEDRLKEGADAAGAAAGPVSSQTVQAKLLKEIVEKQSASGSEFAARLSEIIRSESAVGQSAESVVPPKTEEIRPRMSSEEATKKADKMAAALQDHTTVEFSKWKEMTEASESLRAAGIGNLLRNNESLYTVLDNIKLSWQKRLEKELRIRNAALQGKDVFGRVLKKFDIIDRPNGRLPVDDIFRKMIYNLQYLPFNFPVNFDLSASRQSLADSADHDVSLITQWNTAKAKQYLFFLRDQMTALTMNNVKLEEIFADSDFRDQLADLAKSKGLELEESARTKEKMSDLILRAFDRIMINNVITPSIRSLALGGASGLISLQVDKIPDAGYHYNQCLHMLKNEMPSSAIRYRLSNFLNTESTWLSDARVFMDFSATGVRQSGPFVLSALSEALQDNSLDAIAGISDWKELPGDHVKIHIFELEVERKVKLRNIYNDPVIIEDTVTDTLPNYDLTTQDVVNLIWFYADLNQIDFRTDLSKSTLSRFLNYTGLIAPSDINYESLKQRTIWKLVNNLTIYFTLSDMSTAKVASDPLAPYTNFANASITNITEQYSNIMATCYSNLKKAVFKVLSAIRISDQFFDLAIWDLVKEWDSRMSIPDVDEESMITSTEVEREFSYANAIAKFGEDGDRAYRYLFDERAFKDSKFVIPEETYFLKDWLQQVGASGSIKSELAHNIYFPTTIPGIVDNFALVSSGISRAKLAVRYNQSQMIPLDDPAFGITGRLGYREIKNLQVLAATQDVKATSSGSVVKVRKASDSAFSSANSGDGEFIVDPGQGYCVINEVRPHIEVTFVEETKASGIEHYPRSYAPAIRLKGADTTSSLDSIAHIDWRDNKRHTLLKTLDIAPYFAIEQVELPTISGRVQVQIPTSVSELRQQIYQVSYDATASAITNLTSESGSESSSHTGDDSQIGGPGKKDVAKGNMAQEEVDTKQITQLPDDGSSSSNFEQILSLYNQ